MSSFAKGPSVPPSTAAALEPVEESTGVVSRSLPPGSGLSLQLWGLDLCAELPRGLSSDGVVAVPGDFTRIGNFLRTNYALFGEEAQGSAPSPFVQRSKRAFLGQSSDLLELRHAGETVGVLIGAPEDWSSYYVRMFAVRAEYQRPGLVRRFVRECLFAPLARCGVERVVAETSPANIAMSHLFTELQFRVTGNSLSDRWGPLVRYTKFLTPACEAEFLRRFGGGAPVRKSEASDKEDMP